MNWKCKTSFDHIFVQYEPNYINQGFKACYKFNVFNSCTKSLSINWRNMTFYALFQFRYSLYVSSVDMIFKKSPLSEVTGMYVQRIRRPFFRKLLEIIRSSPKWARSRALTCRSILGDAPSSINTVVSNHCCWRKAGMTYCWRRFQ